MWDFLPPKGFEYDNPHTHNDYAQVTLYLVLYRWRPWV